MLKNLREDLLVCCKENKDALGAIGLTPEQVKKDKYSGTDYEIFITTERNDLGKYHYSAFYKSLEEQNECISLITQWNAYIENNAKQAQASAARLANATASEDDIIEIK